LESHLTGKLDREVTEATDAYNADTVTSSGTVAE
jgi:hypothetical protein